MPLAEAQITFAADTLKALLDPLKSEGARLTLGPVLQGPLSKGEFQIFYGGSTSTPPGQLTFNTTYTQNRTIRYQANLLLKDLRDPDKAVILLEEAKTLVAGVRLFGIQKTEYEGALYPTRDSFRRLNDEAFWYYELQLECQIEDALPLPYNPS
jgi:hypothetical protein